jgi:hypothetical protein
VEPDKKREVRVRINGDLVARAPRPRVDKTRTNDDIRWLLVHAAGELGEQGMAIDPTGGRSNPSDASFQAIKRARGAVPSVERWRKLTRIWDRLSLGSQQVLMVRYRDAERQHTEIVGLRAAFSDLGTLAWHFGQALDPQLALRILRTRVLMQRRARVITSAQARFVWVDLADVQESVDLDHFLAVHEGYQPALIDAAASDLRNRLSRWKPRSNDQVVNALRKRVEAENRRAHLEWLDVERRLALDFKVPPRVVRQ